MKSVCKDCGLVHSRIGRHKARCKIRLEKIRSKR